MNQLPIKKAINKILCEEDPNVTGAEYAGNADGVDPATGQPHTLTQSLNSAWNGVSNMAGQVKDWSYDKLGWNTPRPTGDWTQQSLAPEISKPVNVPSPQLAQPDQPSNSPPQGMRGGYGNYKNLSVGGSADLKLSPTPNLPPVQTQPPATSTPSPNNTNSIANVSMIDQFNQSRFGQAMGGDGSKSFTGLSGAGNTALAAGAGIAALAGGKALYNRNKQNQNQQFQR